MAGYVLGIDQSTQGTKALLFDEAGKLLCRADLPHRQIVNEKGWVEHDPEEIYQNTVGVVKLLVEQSGIDRREIRVLGISNQRETALVWDRATGRPVYNAIVWQCARGAAICEEIKQQKGAENIRSHTGLQLSPYFSAAKIAWVLRHVEGAREQADRGELCCGTVDSWLVYRLTGGKEFRTDYSNASRTQLFNIRTLNWDPEVCRLFGIPTCCLAQVTDSDGCYGETDFEGFLDYPIPIRGVLGDSHGALFGQGAVITWLKDDLKLITSPSETEELAKEANPCDTAYLVPAFSGLGAPYWDSEARAVLYGMTRTTRRPEIVKAGLESIVYQITDVLTAMEQASGIAIEELRVDGGPTRNGYLMQFQSDMAQIPVQVPSSEELSGIGAAYAAGLAAGIYQMETLFDGQERTKFVPSMRREDREQKYRGWRKAVTKALSFDKL